MGGIVGSIGQRGAFYRTEVHLDAIYALLNEGQPVGGFHAKVTRQIVDEMRRTAPKRSGRLRSSIVNAGTTGGGLKRTRNINNTAPYARWVSETTKEYRGVMMHIPRRPQDYRRGAYGEGRKRAQKVGRGVSGPRPGDAGDYIWTNNRAGYVGNPYIERSVDTVLARNGLLY